jgi:sec-independent protein translocase protein TatA
MFDAAFANPIHWIFAIIVLVLVFGANKLGDIGGALGKSVNEFKKATHESDPPATSTSPADEPTATAPTLILPPATIRDYRPAVPEYRPPAR